MIGFLFFIIIIWNDFSLIVPIINISDEYIGTYIYLYYYLFAIFIVYTRTILTYWKFIISPKINK